ncbi:hypothetical protein ACFL6U_12650 [Planctomycetota bacterium]
MWTEHPIKTMYLTIYESELRVIAGLSALWGKRKFETGGAMLGLWTHGSQPVVLLVTGPGQKAVQTSTYFEQDVGFVHRVNNLVAEKFGIQLIGFDHGHHFLGIPHPSGRDLHQVQSISSKNNFTKWCEIITTCEKDNDSVNGDTNAPSQVLSLSHGMRVKIHAYLYTDPESGKKTEVSLRVLKGVSPFRVMALASGELTPDDIGEYATGFPRGNIIFRSFVPQKTLPTIKPAVIESLTKQFQELPAEVQVGIKIDAQEDFTIVAFPITRENTLRVAYSKHPPYSILAISVQSNHTGHTKDMSNLLLRDNGNPTLVSLYETLRHGDLNIETDSKIFVGQCLRPVQPMQSRKLINPEIESRSNNNGKFRMAKPRGLRRWPCFQGLSRKPITQRKR